ncbi:MAG: hypothetical protein Q4E20_07135, partial [Eubacteriales bacterium]|nr:hypothetical protein [Eubacteriales bacterium]
MLFEEVNIHGNYTPDAPAHRQRPHGGTGHDVLAVVSIPNALQTPLQVDMGLDYIFPTNELLGNMVSADQSAMKTIFNVDDEHQLATENWLKNYTTNTDTA